MADRLSGDDLRAARERLGESQAQFGERFGVDQSTIHRWETDGISDRGTTKLAVERVLADISSPPQSPTDSHDDQHQHADDGAAADPVDAHEVTS